MSGGLKFASRSTTFSKNFLTTPVQVFSASVTWPKISGNPTTNPATFTSTYAFPFKSPWPYSGQNDAGLDYQFSGGTMANNARRPLRNKRAIISETTTSAPSRLLNMPLTIASCQMTLM